MTKLRFERVTTAAGLLLALSTAAWAGTTTPHATGANQNTTLTTRQFIEHAAIGGMAEVKLGQLAQQKAASDEVKNFGKRMVDDHSKANDELKRLASKKHVTLPKDVGAKHKSVYERLSKLSGQEFDREFMDTMAKDHQEVVAEFEKAAKSSDPDVQAFASRTLPTLHAHLDSAQQIVSSVNGRGEGMTAGRPRVR